VDAIKEIERNEISIKLVTSPLYSIICQNVDAKKGFVIMEETLEKLGTV